MKKLLLVILVLFSTFSFSQKEFIRVNPGRSVEPEISVLSSGQNGFVLEVSLPGFFVEELNQGEKQFQRLSIDPYSTTQIIGKPELPLLNEIVGIPDNKMAGIEIIEKSEIVLSNYVVYPYQTPSKDVRGGKPEGFDYDTKFYSKNQFFPEEVVSIDEPGIWRDVKIAGLHIAPVRYNPALKELRVITSMRLQITFEGTDQVASGRSKMITPDFYHMYNTKILNFPSLGFESIQSADTAIKYLVITNTGALAAIQPLVDWKNQQGYRVEVRTIGTGFSTPQDFKNYITQLYNNQNLEYVLMVGDAYPNGGSAGGTNIVPMYYWSPAGEDPSYSDTWYVCLNGTDDHYADLAIGRFTYDNVTELQLQIQKTMGHYFSPDQTTNWAENSLLVAHDESYPQKYTECKEQIRTFNYTLQTPIFTQCYGGAGANNTTIVNFINNTSCGIFNYRGHGSQTEFWQWCPSGSFTNTHIQQFTNEHKLFVLFDVCCDNMDIVGYNGNCLCESFMKSPVAAVAINGAIIPSYTTPNHDYDKEMYKAIFNNGITNIGYITNYANITVLNNHGSMGRSNVRTYLWLGDASLEPWTKLADTLLVSHNPQLFLGLSQFDVTVLGPSGPVSNARVCVSNAAGTVYAVAFSDAAGFAQVQFPGPVQDPGNAFVTVTKHNFLPYQDTIDIIPQSGPYVIRQSYQINDQAGNNNGLLDYGESVQLTLTVENVGIAQATGVNVTLSTSDNYITMTDSTAFYGTIGASNTASVTNGFAFTVANSLPDGHYVPFTVVATDGTNNWTSTFAIEGHAPVLQLGSFTISDPSGNGNGKLDPGETVSFMIEALNNGSSEALNVTGNLITTDPFVTISTSSQNYGNLAGGATNQKVFSVTANAATPAGHTASFDFNITATGGLTGSDSLSTVIGQVPVLILDLDPNTSSGPSMQTALQGLGISSDYLTSFPTDLNIYTSVFVCLGIYSSNHVLSTTEGQTLAGYVNAGGNLYMEGGDTWYYDTQTAVHSLFSINATGDGSADLNTISGHNGTFTENMSFSYSGENNYIDRLSPSGSAFAILSNNSPSYGTAIAYDQGNYRTIGASHEFGGLNNGTVPSTREELMKQYLIFFGIMSDGVSANFFGGVTSLCVGNSVTFIDLSVGSITSWDWYFEGGNPMTSTQQSPVVTYSNAGTFDVRLIVSDGMHSDTLEALDYIQVYDLPIVTLQPFTNVCVNWPAFVLAGGQPSGGIYSGTGVANGYFDPDIAGVGTHEIYYTYADNHGCMDSTSQNIMVDACSGIEDYSGSVDITVFPNPSDGVFSVILQGFKPGSTTIKIYNMLHELVYCSEYEAGDDRNIITIQAEGLSEGVYMITAENGKQIAGKRIILSK